MTYWVLPPELNPFNFLFRIIVHISFSAESAILANSPLHSLENLRFGSVVLHDGLNCVFRLIPAPSPSGEGGVLHSSIQACV